MTAGRVLFRVLESIAVAKLLLGLLALGLVWTAFPQDAWRYAAYILIFGCVGGFLVAMGGQDRRAEALGAFFLVIGTAWTDLPLELASARLLDPIGGVLMYAQVSAFAPFLFWTFVRDFPRRIEPRHPRLLQFAIRLTLFAGLLLFLVNLSLLLPLPEALASAVRYVDRNTESVYWTVIFVVSLPAVVYAAAQARQASPDERRRVRILLAGIVFGLVPDMILVFLHTSSPELSEWLRSAEAQRIQRLTVTPALMSVPFVTAYAVVVHRALEIRLIVRRAIQYALARSFVGITAAIPFAFVVLTLYSGREQSLSSLAAGSSGWVLAGAAGMGFTLIVMRDPILNAVDRRFFREQYDSRVLLSGLSRGILSVAEPVELARDLQVNIDGALHLTRIEPLFFDSRLGCLASPERTAPSLSITSGIADLLEDGEPIEIELTRPDPRLAHLPEDDRRWLESVGAHLIVPITGRYGALLGLLVLGDKRSELPFSSEDRLLLQAVAASAAVVVERNFPGGGRSTGADGGPRPLEQPARECLACGTVTEAGTARCDHCGESTVEARVPLLLVGKFRVTERLGSGGMGVVYRAVDLSLNRDVAVKCLPRASAAEVRRMRKEARIMASVIDPGLALIFGAESWNGVPILVIELLEGGTLDERLRNGPMEPGEAIELVHALLAPLARLHEAGILHRDIKPSNVGFTAAGSPKLLDFGLAHLLEGVIAGSAGSARAGGAGLWESATIGTAGAGPVAGTPLYLSPEAVNGRLPDASFDLWATSMVLYETLLGSHPLEGQEGDWLSRLSRADLPDPHALLPSAPMAVADYLADALAPDRSRRPATAREMADRLAELRRVVAEPPSSAAARD